MSFYNVFVLQMGMDSPVISSITQPHLPTLFMVLPLVTPRLVYFEEVL